MSCATVSRTPGRWILITAGRPFASVVNDAGTVAYVAHMVGFGAGLLQARPLKPGTPPPPQPHGVLFGRRAR
jgi:hypothetical protein